MWHVMLPKTHFPTHALPTTLFSPSRASNLSLPSYHICYTIVNWASALHFLLLSLCKIHSSSMLSTWGNPILSASTTIGPFHNSIVRHLLYHRKSSKRFTFPTDKSFQDTPLIYVIYFKRSQPADLHDHWELTSNTKIFNIFYLSYIYTIV